MGDHYTFEQQCTCRRFKKRGTQPPTTNYSTITDSTPTSTGTCRQMLFLKFEKLCRSLQDAAMQFDSEHSELLSDAFLLIDLPQVSEFGHITDTDYDLTNFNLTDADVTNADLTDFDLANFDLTDADLTDFDSA